MSIQMPFRTLYSCTETTNLALSSFVWDGCCKSVSIHFNFRFIYQIYKKINFFKCKIKKMFYSVIDLFFVALVKVKTNLNWFTYIQGFLNNAINGITFYINIIFYNLIGYS